MAADICHSAQRMLALLLKGHAAPQPLLHQHNTHQGNVPPVLRTSPRPASERRWGRCRRRPCSRGAAASRHQSPADRQCEQGTARGVSRVVCMGKRLDSRSTRSCPATSVGMETQQRQQQQQQQRRQQQTAATLMQLPTCTGMPSSRASSPASTSMPPVRTPPAAPTSSGSSSSSSSSCEVQQEPGNSAPAAAAACRIKHSKQRCAPAAHAQQQHHA